MKQTSIRPLPIAIAALGALPFALIAQARPAAATTQASATNTARRAFTPADWYKVTTLSAPAVSPDGKLVAFTVTTVRESENKRHNEVWVVPAAGGEATRYTSASTESSNPRFSADGKYLLFNSTRQGSRARTWALRMDQPGGEAMEMNDYPNGSLPRDKSFAVWSEPVTPDSAADSTRRRDPYAAMQAMARPPYGAITQPLDPKRFDGRHIYDMRYKANGQGFVPGPREARVWRPTQIWTQKLDGTSKKQQLETTAYSRRSATVSPDGKWIAFAADAQLRPDSVAEAERDSLARLPYDAKRDEVARNESDIFVIPVTGGQPRRLTSAVGAEGDLAWSPDGKRISFTSAPTRVASQRIYVVDVAGGEPVNLLGTWQYEPDSYEWMPNGDIAFSASVGGRSALFRLNPATKKITEVIGGRRRLNGFTFDGAKRTVAYVSTAVDAPTELYIANADGTGERKLTSFNDKLNQQIAWAPAERFTYPSVGGLEVEGWLMKPANYEAGKKYPLVLYIHGGPHSQYNEGWFDEFQSLAGAGMFVLYTNPRGSSGYGGDFTYSTRGRWGAEDYEDLMKAVDIASKRPDVDSTKMGVTGGSYGGFMTAWITAKTNRFKAAQADRMISEWTYWYGASDAQGLTEFEFYGKPWDNFAMYDSLSPIRKVSKVKTPTLIVQSEEDFRTPMGNADLWFIALKKQGVPVELVRYPRSTHDLSRTGEPWLLVDRLGRIRQWFGFWLNGEKQQMAGTPASDSR
ncbi:MAG TPA: S9 family peptidase [Gemmatimonadaceae bacterium]|nr:S9 family peptidase [Gemmatimonadaceae bacterium]